MSFTIVYLDDEPDLLELFKDMFSSEYVKILTFEDAGKAVVAIKESPPDLVFIDYRLKGITGDKVALLLDPALPKAMITGELNLRIDNEIFRAFFQKPYEVSAIQAFIDKQVDTARALHG